MSAEGSSRPDPVTVRLRRDMVAIREAALRAVDPFAAVARNLRVEGSTLYAGRDQRIAVPLTRPASDEPRRILVLGVGKAAAPMCSAGCRALAGFPITGVVVTKYGHAEGLEGVRGLPSALQVIEAGHPVPDAASLTAARNITRLLSETTVNDVLVLLLSGGGSALLSAPAAAITLEDLQTTTDVLLRSGATIAELNTIRKHLSALKGGQLARLAAPAPTIALVLSDVVGDPLDVIASGPTSPDGSTFREAWGVLQQYGVVDDIPARVLRHLEGGVNGHVPETPKPGDPLFDAVHNVIVGSNKQAAEAAVAEAESLGYASLLLTTYIEGEAREVAKVAVALAKSLKHAGRPLVPPACLVWGGETTVTVRGQGKGGRNQELALAAAEGLSGMKGIALMALATDGTDGPTDAAGAIVDGFTAERARTIGWDIRAALRDNDAYPLLEAAGDLMLLGPTGTNVNDLLVLLAA